MSNGLYTIYDKLAEEHGPVFQAGNDAVAIRATCELLTDVFDARDFILIKVADIEPKSAKIVVLDNPVHIDFYPQYDAFLARHIESLRIKEISDEARS